MSPALRKALLPISAAAAGALASLFGSRHLLTPEAPPYVVALIPLLAWGMWFLILLPAWLPAVVPSSWPRIARAASVLSGVALLLAAATWAGALAFLGGRPSWPTVSQADGLQLASPASV